MKRRKTTYRDPVVEEVRRVRAMMWKEGGGTLEGYFALLDRKMAELKADGTMKFKYRQAPKPRARRRAS